MSTSTQHVTDEKVKALFVIHKFEVKSLSESAGYLEVARPMIESGYLATHKVISFGRALEFYQETIDTRLTQLVEEWGESPVVIYGAGAHTQQFLDKFQKLNVVALSDRDSTFWGTTRFGFEVISPSEVSSVSKHVLVSSRAYEASILVDLRQRYGESIVVAGLYMGYAEDYKNQIIQKLDDEIKAFKPNLIVYTPTHPSENIRSGYFLTLKSKYPAIKIVNIWWDYDEQAEQGSYLDYERDCLLYSDYVIENSNQSRLDKMQRQIPPYQHHHNVDKVHFHPTVFDSTLFHPDSGDNDGKQKSVDVAIWGSSAGQRAKWIEFLQQAYPNQFQQFGGVYQGDEPLPSEQYASKYRCTKIAVNTQTYPFRSQCKGKVREAITSGTFLLEEDNPETRTLLPEGLGLIYFSGAEDLKQKIDYYLCHHDERETIAKAGYDWFCEHYNAVSWTAEILTNLGFLTCIKNENRKLAINHAL